MKTINIDEFLKERAVEIQLGEKKFPVTDISEETQKLMQKNDETEFDAKAIVKSLLGCKDEDLKGYGMAAFNAIINEVTKNLFRDSSQNDQSGS